MNALKKHFVRLICDQNGGEVLEYAIVAGLIVVGAVVLIGAVGTKVAAKWNTVSDAPL